MLGQDRSRDSAYSARNRGYRCNAGLAGIEIYVSDKFVILNVDAYIYDNLFIVNHIFIY